MRPIVLRLIAGLIIIAAVFAIALFANNDSRVDRLSGELILAVNDLNNGDPTASARYDEIKTAISNTASGQGVLVLALCLTLGLCAAFFLYVYLTILRPFYKLERFAQNVAAGDYDKPLDMPRHNVFGAFSWAFDSMREGLHDAQKAEQDAKSANKLLIATISHDIKTPIASIRACAEALTSGQASTDERRQRYLGTIMRKSDEVVHLTDDLFLHAISDMDRLEVIPEEVYLADIVADITAGFEINLLGDVPQVQVIADKKRLLEAFGNIIKNVEKYAPTSPVSLSFNQTDDMMNCVFSDTGQSLSPEDVPFIFDKFYRGKNAGDNKGSGLGLYIVRYIAEKLGGASTAERTPDGLKIIVSLRTS